MTETLREKGFTKCEHPTYTDFASIVDLSPGWLFRKSNPRVWRRQCNHCGAEFSFGKWRGGTLDYRKEPSQQEALDYFLKQAMNHAERMAVAAVNAENDLKLAELFFMETQPAKAGEREET